MNGYFKCYSEDGELIKEGNWEMGRYIEEK